jgi:hypothetical protein
MEFMSKINTAKSNSSQNQTLFVGLEDNRARFNKALDVFPKEENIYF